MEKVVLNGLWNIVSTDGVFNIQGKIPGTDFGNLIKEGQIKNPLISGIEQEALKTAEKDFTFSREFEIDEKILEYKNVALKCNTVDTLASIFINDKKVFENINSYIPLDVDVKDALKAGKNTIRFEFHSAYLYIKGRQEKDPLPNNFNGVNGIPYIRKPGCHFGWDWGPCVPYCGILDDIYLKAYNEKIDNISIKQKTTKEVASLTISADGAKNIYIETPDNKKIEVKDGKVEIKNPKLWYTRELSQQREQPLYSVVFENDEETIVKKIGLRELYLDQSEDEYGRNFSIMLNGERVFAKGGNLIPFAAIYEDITKESIDYYINLAIESNFNIIRVWGGGSYADEYLLSECDRLGLLVWQDFCFACQLYPFYEKDFLDTVVEEIETNVKRMSLHPSVAIFAGNNEIETIYSWMPQSTKLQKAYKEFFYDIMPKTLASITDVSYIPTSPLGSDYMKNISSDNYGDTHMWNVWHGLKKLDYYQTRYSRFLSEFGLESLPSMKAINTFATPADYDITSAAFNSHQKCIGGNKKMLFYLTEMFDFPKHFEALPYLTGIVQAECIKNAAVHFRQNKGRCNGAIYWQYNDVWNCPSWASVDFEGVPKALQYKARDFFNPVTVTCKKQDGVATIFAHNDTLEKKSFKIKVEEYSIKDNSLIEEHKYSVDLKPNSFERVVDLKARYNAVMKITYNNESIYEIFDKPSSLPLNKVEFKVTKEGNKATIKALDNFAYNICVESDAIASENYFSLLKGEEKTITFNKAPENINIVCANNIEFDKNAFRKFFFRLFYRLQPLNIANFIYYSRT